MTTRHSGLIVTLEHDIREDDLESVMEAIRHIRFVAAVDPVPGSNLGVHMAKRQLRFDLMKKVLDLFREETA